MTQSEGKLQAKLDLPRIRERASNRGGRNNARSRSVKEPDTLLKSSGPVEIRMVGEVERLGPKLDALGFPERDVFHKRKIEVCQAGADDSVASEIAVKSGIRQTKSAGIEVEVGSSQFRAGRDTLGQPFVTPFTGLLLKPGSKSGRSVICPPLAPFRERLNPVRMLTGVPSANVRIPLSCQPESSFPAAPVIFRAKGRS